MGSWELRVALAPLVALSPTILSHGLLAEPDRLIRGSISLLILTLGFPTSGLISPSDSPKNVLSVTEATFSTLSATIPIGVLTKMMTATTRSGVNFVGMSESVKVAVATNLEVIDR